MQIVSGPFGPRAYQLDKDIPTYRDPNASIARALQTSSKANTPKNQPTTFGTVSITDYLKGTVYSTPPVTHWFQFANPHLLAGYFS
jgi:hypothetical protein